MLGHKHTHGFLSSLENDSPAARFHIGLAASFISIALGPYSAFLLGSDSLRLH